MRDLVVIANDIRSTHNVGSLFRTADGIGVSKIYLTGYTPYPSSPEDGRLPHISAKLMTQIDKTALGASKFVAWEHVDNPFDVLSMLKADGYTIAALEQTADAVQLSHYQAPNKIAILLGNEVQGIEKKLIDACDISLIIKMFGKKESYNVIQAAAMALYRLRFH